MRLLQKVGFIFLTLICLSEIGSSQTFANHWIDSAKTYFKLKVAQNGIYRLTFEELKSAGFIFDGVDSKSLKLINFGKEQAIYVNSTTFGSGSFIEFYGEKNTIGLDSLLYSNWKTDLFNPEYSLVTDTNAYFLTIAPETENLRYKQVNPDFGSSATVFPYYLHEEKIVFTDTYFKNVDSDIRYSHFEPSEGFGDALRQSSTTSINTSQISPIGPSPILSFRIGQNNQVAKLEISFNGILKASPFINPRLTIQFNFTLDKIELKNSNTLTLKNIQSANDRHRISVVSLTYPRSLDFGNKPSYTFVLPESSNERKLEISSFKTSNSNAFLYDIKNKIRYATTTVNDKIISIVNPVTYNTKYIKNKRY